MTATTAALLSTQISSPTPATSELWTLDNTSNSWAPVTCVTQTNSQPTVPHTIFCTRVALGTIQACLDHEYHLFDGHTTANCCHGVSLLVKYLIDEAWDLGLDFGSLLRQGQSYLKSLRGMSVDTSESIHEPWEIPSALLELSGLYVLTVASSTDKEKTRRIDTKRLLPLGPVSRRFCDQLVKRIQMRLTNMVAQRYAHLVGSEFHHQRISGTAVGSWLGYVQERHTRRDRRGRRYVACLHSMQVALAHLITTNTPVVFLNDIHASDSGTVHRYLRVLEPDISREKLTTKPVSARRIGQLPNQTAVVVFAGTALASENAIAELGERLDLWCHEFPSLVLANDIHYPQFPPVGDDLEFDSSGLAINDQSIKTSIRKLRLVQGVSTNDRSLFCLSHIFPASVQQVRQVVAGDLSALPSWATGSACATQTAADELYPV